jgi:tetratricopeptide (TPR) repeat protein
MQRPTLIALLLLVATLGVYAQTASFEFIGLDDDVWVYRNPDFVDGIGWEDVPAQFAFGRETANWVPLTMLSLALDVALFGLDDAGPFHAVNTALHLLATLLCFGALRALTGRDVESGFVAAAFALHPLHVESVAWVTERKDVLAGVCWWGASWLHALAVRDGARWAGRAALAVFALGLMAKPLLVTLPCALLLFDLWPLRRRVSREAVVEKLGYFALVAISIVLTWIAQSRAGAVASFEVVSTGGRIANALVAYATYLGQALWPSGLGIYYPHPTAPGQAALAGLEIAGALALLVACTGAALWAYQRGQRAVLVGWLFFVGVLVPMIGLVQVGHAAHADRYMYVPLVGLAIAVVYPLGDWARGVGAPAAAARTLVAAGLAVCALWGVTAYRQTALWRDTQALFEHTLAHTSRNATIHYNLGYWHQERGNAEPAERHFAAAHEIDPGHAGAAVNLGLMRFLAGDREAGVALIEEGLRADPEHARGYLNLAIALVQLGELEPADAHLARVIASEAWEFREDRLRALRMRGELAVLRGDSAAMVAHYEAALAAAPDDLELLRGAVIRFTALPDAALHARALAPARPAVELDREAPARALELRAGAELATGDRQAAERSLEAALGALPPDDAAARARLLERLGSLRTGR